MRDPGLLLDCVPAGGSRPPPCAGTILGCVLASSRRTPARAGSPGSSSTVCPPVGVGLPPAQARSSGSRVLRTHPRAGAIPGLVLDRVPAGRSRASPCAGTILGRVLAGAIPGIVLDGVFRGRSRTSPARARSPAASSMTSASCSAAEAGRPPVRARSPTSSSAVCSTPTRADVHRRMRPPPCSTQHARPHPPYSAFSATSHGGSASNSSSANSLTRRLVRHTSPRVASYAASGASPPTPCRGRAAISSCRRKSPEWWGDVLNRSGERRRKGHSRPTSHRLLLQNHCSPLGTTSTKSCLAAEA